MTCLREQALHWLQQADPANKASGVRALPGLALNVNPSLLMQCAAPLPGRPARPELVAPRQTTQRGIGSVPGRAALLHALAHIEFNAINLALDAIWRFSEMPATYYTDWCKVAAEEAYHFTLLSDHLQSLGYTYGDFSAHDGLWEMAEKTSGDVLARMALVPRLLEARGLDASPPIRAKLAAAGDQAAAKILDIILHDEIGHVEIGNRWYRFLCEARGIDPVAKFEALLTQYAAPQPKGPFNLPARKLAGFTAEELVWLTR